MRNTLVAAIFVSAVAALVAQEPPLPTIEQCRTYYAMWAPRGLDTNAFNADASKATIDRLSARDLYTRSRMMDDCSTLAVAQHGVEHATQDDVNESFKYSGLSGLYTAALASRYRNYIDRHKLWAQFATEDAAGLR
jgi:hypothetical protein